MNIVWETDYMPLIRAMQIEAGGFDGADHLDTIIKAISIGALAKVFRLEADDGTLMGVAAVNYDAAMSVTYMKLRDNALSDENQIITDLKKLAADYAPI